MRGSECAAAQKRGVKPNLFALFAFAVKTQAGALFKMSKTSMKNRVEGVSHAQNDKHLDELSHGTVYDHGLGVNSL